MTPTAESVAAEFALHPLNSIEARLVEYGSTLDEVFSWRESKKFIECASIGIGTASLFMATHEGSLDAELTARALSLHRGLAALGSEARRRLTELAYLCSAARNPAKAGMRLAEAAQAAGSELAADVCGAFLYQWALGMARNPSTPNDPRHPNQAALTRVFVRHARGGSPYFASLALISAAHMGDAPLLRDLLEAGVEGFSVLANNHSALTMACSRSFAGPGSAPIECVSLLLDRGAPVDGRDGYGFTPLGIVALSGDAAGAHLLLDAGADPWLPGRLPPLSRDPASGWGHNIEPGLPSIDFLEKIDGLAARCLSIREGPALLGITVPTLSRTARPRI